jgi:hypothetical protein
MKESINKSVRSLLRIKYQPKRALPRQDLMATPTGETKYIMLGYGKPYRITRPNADWK